MPSHLGMFLAGQGGPYLSLVVPAPLEAEVVLLDPGVWSHTGQHSDNPSFNIFKK